MVCERLSARGERVSPDDVDEALQAFWRGSAGEIDRLVGANERDAASAGEMLLMLWHIVGARRGGSGRRSEFKALRVQMTVK